MIRYILTALFATTCLFAATPAVAAETEDGFRSLFDGKTLKGWDGNTELWTVQDGVITGQTTKEKPTKGNTFLIWRDGALGDFELRLQFRIVGGNSGIQYRSREVSKWVVAGYQADFDGAGNWTGTLVNALIAHCGKSLSGIGGVRRPGIVHRLDKDTSGLIIAAKNDAAHASLSAQFAARTIARAYLAVVWGTPSPAAGAIEGNVGRHPGNRKKMAVLARGGKPARTNYRTLQAFATAASVLECPLETGRTHQIRVHLAAKGHPLLGDPVYGGGQASRIRRLPEAARAAPKIIARQALHARLIGFRHPQGAAWLEFASNVPIDIKGLIDGLAAGTGVLLPN